MESTATYGPPPPQIFLAPNTLPVIKKRDHKGGAGGLPLQRKPKSNKGGGGGRGLPLQKRNNMQKERGVQGVSPCKRKKKSFPVFPPVTTAYDSSWPIYD